MPEKMFPKDQIKELFNSRRSEGLEFIKQTEWTSEYKYDFCSLIFKDIQDEKVYCCNILRTGTYFTDYFYDFEINCFEVKEIEKTIKEWVKVI